MLINGLSSSGRLLLFIIGFFIFVSACLHAQTTTGTPVLIDLGSTTDPYVSYLVIDDQSLGNSAIEYAWHYSSLFESDGTTPLNGDDLMNAVIELSATNAQYALTPITEGGGGIDAGINGFQIGTQTSSVISIYSISPAYWTYWIKGGSQTESYSPYETFNPTSWIIAPDWSANRLIANGSYDGWTLDPYDSDTSSYSGNEPLYTAMAVPEPTSSLLILLSLSTLAVITRWKQLHNNL